MEGLNYSPQSILDENIETEISDVLNTTVSAKLISQLNSSQDPVTAYDPPKNHLIRAIVANSAVDKHLALLTKKDFCNLQRLVAEL